MKSIVESISAMLFIYPLNNLIIHIEIHRLLLLIKTFVIAINVAQLIHGSI